MVSPSTLSKVGWAILAVPLFFFLIVGVLEGIGLDFLLDVLPWGLWIGVLVLLMIGGILLYIGKREKEREDWELMRKRKIIERDVLTAIVICGLGSVFLSFLWFGILDIGFVIILSTGLLFCSSAFWVILKTLFSVIKREREIPYPWNVLVIVAGGVVLMILFLILLLILGPFLES